MIEFSKHLKLELKAARFITSLVGFRRDDSRFHINHLEVNQDGSAVATDGCRLYHLSNFTVRGQVLAPGFYRVLKNTKSKVWIERVPDGEVCGSFPDYGDILSMEEREGSRGKVVLDMDLSYDGQYEGFARFIRACPGKNYFNYNFFDEVCEKFDHTGTVTILIDIRREDDHQIQDPAIFKMEEEGVIFQAVIMPMRG